MTNSRITYENLSGQTLLQTFNYVLKDIVVYISLCLPTQEDICFLQNLFQHFPLTFTYYFDNFTSKMYIRFGRGT